MSRVSRWLRRKGLVWGDLGMTAALPVYVTRKTAGGQTASYSLSLWQSLLAVFLIWANVIVWCLVGLYTAVGVVI